MIGYVLSVSRTRLSLLSLWNIFQVMLLLKFLICEKEHAIYNIVWKNKFALTKAQSLRY